MLLAGLTGNYGMGKSTVLHIFEKLGAVTRDSDEIVGSLFEEEDVIKRNTGVIECAGCKRLMHAFAIIAADHARADSRPNLHRGQ